MRRMWPARSNSRRSRFVELVLGHGAQGVGDGHHRVVGVHLVDGVGVARVGDDGGVVVGVVDQPALVDAVVAPGGDAAGVHGPRRGGGAGRQEQQERGCRWRHGEMLPQNAGVVRFPDSGGDRKYPRCESFQRDCDGNAPPAYDVNSAGYTSASVGILRLRRLKPAKEVVLLIGNTPDLLDWSLVESVD